MIADVTVRQIYENGGPRPINARYVFPASTRAAVYGMTMIVGNVRTVARIRERETAKREFEAAKSEGKNAALLEQSRPNVFTMKLANVMPNDTIVVELKYTELLVPTDGLYASSCTRPWSGRATPTRLKARRRRKTRSSRLRTASGRAGAQRVPFLGQALDWRARSRSSTSPSHQLVTRDSGNGRAK